MSVNFIEMYLNFIYIKFTHVTHAVQWFSVSLPSCGMHNWYSGIYIYIYIGIPVVYTYITIIEC